jgi:hypothetical protein
MKQEAGYTEISENLYQTNFNEGRKREIFQIL